MTTSTEPASPANSLETSRARRWGALIVGLALGIATAAISVVLAVDTVSKGETIVVIGALGSQQFLVLAVVAAFAALASGLCLIPVPKRWLLLLVPARMAAIACTGLAIFVAGFTGPSTVSPLISDSCDTGYVVVERSFLFYGGGSVYRIDGILATRVAGTVGDDGYRPISDGNYSATTENGTVSVWYNSDPMMSPSPPVATGQPAFTVPELSGRTGACGIQVPVPAGRGVATPTPDPVLPGSEADVREMLRASLTAADGPVRARDGSEIDPEAVPLQAIACADGGTASSLSLEFQTGDNALTLKQILRVWDAAGYLPDRAMQEDIRWSPTLPIEKMTIRDSTTINGLMRLGISGRCTNN